MKKETKKVVGYCRVSTENQKDEGTIEIQQRAIREYCKKEGFELGEIFSDEGISGSKELENRPALSDLFSRIEANGLYAVIIYKLDRLARDLMISEYLIRKLQNMGILVISICEPNLERTEPMAKAFRQFMGIFAELERDMITLRLSAGRKNKAINGGHAGGRTPYGFTANERELHPDPEKFKILKKIFSLKKAKNSYRTIAAWLNENAIEPPQGAKWHPGTIQFICKNQIYKGILSYQGIATRKPDFCVR
jgi:site-specific DNA recombinase